MATNRSGRKTTSTKPRTVKDDPPAKRTVSRSATAKAKEMIFQTAIIRYKQLANAIKADKDEQNTQKEIISGGMLSLVKPDADGKRTYSFVDDDSNRHQVTWVEPSSVMVDEDIVREEVGDEFFNANLTKTVFDEQAFADLVASGAIGKDVLVKASIVVPKAAYPKIT